VGAAGQVPPGEILGRSRVEDLGAGALCAQYVAECEGLELAGEGLVERRVLPTVQVGVVAEETGASGGSATTRRTNSCRLMGWSA
jgi:hypothetical protein